MLYTCTEKMNLQYKEILNNLPGEVCLIEAVNKRKENCSYSLHIIHSAQS